MRKKVIFTTATAALLTTGCASLGKALGMDISPAEAQQAGEAAKQAGQYISAIWPAVGGVITTGGALVAWFNEREKRGKHEETNKKIMKAIENYKQDDNTEWDDLKSYLEAAGATVEEAKEIYDSFKQDGSL